MWSVSRGTQKDGGESLTRQQEGKREKQGELSNISTQWDTHWLLESCHLCRWPGNHQAILGKCHSFKCLQSTKSKGTKGNANHGQGAELGSSTWQKQGLSPPCTQDSMHQEDLFLLKKFLILRPLSAFQMCGKGNKHTGTAQFVWWEAWVLQVQ